MKKEVFLDLFIFLSRFGAIFVLAFMLELNTKQTIFISFFLALILFNIENNKGELENKISELKQLLEKDEL